MKGITFGVIAAAIILSSPALAQSQYDTDSQTNTQTTTTNQTVSGVVVSSTTDQLVVRTDTGREMTFEVDTATTLPTGTLTPGSTIRVDYRMNDLNGYDAVVVRTGAATGSQLDANRTTTSTTDATNRTGTTTTTTDRTTTTTTDRTTTTGMNDTNRLPATASPLPLIGLLSLGALAVSYGVRRWRKA
jgi:hypothetical protein